MREVLLLCFVGGEGFRVQGECGRKARVMAQTGTLGSCCNVLLQFCPFPPERCRVGRLRLLGRSLSCIHFCNGKIRAQLLRLGQPLGPPAPRTVLPLMLPSPATCRHRGREKYSLQGFGAAPGGPSLAASSTDHIVRVILPFVQPRRGVFCL